MDAKATLKRISVLLLDEAQDWATDNFLIGFLNQVYEDVFNELNDCNWPFDESVVPITAVGIGTANLSASQASGGPLEFMLLPVSIDWKPTGDPDTSYLPVRKVDKLDDIAAQVGVTQYEYRGMVVYFTPSTTIVDLRVRAQMLFAELTDVDKPLALNSIRNLLAYRCAALVQGVREKYKQAQFLQIEGDKQLDLLISNFVKKDQGTIRRFGSVARLRRGPRYRTPRVNG